MGPMLRVTGRFRVSASALKGVPASGAPVCSPTFSNPPWFRPIGSPSDSQTEGSDVRLNTDGSATACVSRTLEWARVLVDVSSVYAGQQAFRSGPYRVSPGLSCRDGLLTLPPIPRESECISEKETIMNTPIPSGREGIEAEKDSNEAGGPARAWVCIVGASGKLGRYWSSTRWTGATRWSRCAARSAW